MADNFTIALPYSGNRYYFTMPAGGLQSKIDFKMWGAGGGAGGADSHGGGNGAGGGFVTGSVSAPPGATVEVFVGQGGSGGRSGVSGWGGGAGGYTLAAYAGGTGGNAGGAGSSGGGGGGGGATVLKISNSVVAIAGGGGAGGGGGNRGPYPYGESAKGAMVPGSNSQTYPVVGGNNAEWSWLLNVYGIWQGNGSYTWSVYFPATQHYQFDLAADDYGWLYVDDVEMVYDPSYDAIASATQTISAGWHTVSVHGTNTDGPGAIGARILQNGNTIWTTRSPISPGSSTHGFNGGNCGGDGGGGGAGGGGYFGGANYGPRPWYDTGGYAGANGANFVSSAGTNPANTGSYGNGVTSGGASDNQYPGSSVGRGGYANGGTGGNGYALLTFYKAAGFYVNDQGTYRRVVPKIKIAGSYSNNAIAWIKVDGVWRQVIADSTVSFSNDSLGWGG